MSDYKEIPAEFSSLSWENGSDYGYDDSVFKAEVISLAAIAEMMDRTHYNVWSIKNNLNGVLTPP